MERHGFYMVKNIILDVGKVLVEWDPDMAFRRLGFEGETLRAVKEATVASPDWNEFDRCALSYEDMLAKFISNAPEYEKEIRLVWDNVGLPISRYDYSIPWIRRMKQKGYKVYILSNYSKWTYENTMEALSFLEDVDGALFSFQVQQIKPEQEIYQSLLDKYHLQPQESVFIDDRQENIDAAVKQGIHGIRFTTYEETLRELEQYGIKL